MVRAAVRGPSEETRESARVELWGRAWVERGGQEQQDRQHGRAVESFLTTPEGYSLTAATAVECARRVEVGELAPGAWTPAAAFGADFVTSFPGASWGELRTRS